MVYPTGIRSVRIADKCTWYKQETVILIWQTVALFRSWLIRVQDQALGCLCWSVLNLHLHFFFFYHEVLYLKAQTSDILDLDSIPSWFMKYWLVQYPSGVHNTTSDLDISVVAHGLLQRCSQRQ